MNNKSLFNLGLGLLLLILIIGGFSIYSYVNSIQINKSTEAQINEQEDYSKVHGGIYHLHVQRSALMKKMLSAKNFEKLGTFREDFLKNREEQGNLHKQCKHMDVSPMPEIFLRQGKSMGEYIKLEDLSLIHI